MSKTCGECSLFSEGGNRCKLFINQYIFGDRPACNNFKPKPTNGDRIRGMSNEELVRFKGARHCTFCAYCDQKTDKCNRPIGGTCAEGILEWLNAPADCVAENGKSAKQADLCCKSAKESGGGR